jgi:spore coat polysaccharide biosynthesis protein SpsF
MKRTEQEDFWYGAFGDEYIVRNKDESLLASNISFFAKVLSNSQDIDSVFEFGCNIGMNLKAIKALLPMTKLSGVEINKSAVNDIRKNNEIEVIEDSILDLEIDTKFDLTLIKTVLIHINPDRLDEVYSRLYEYSNKYICIAEYYNPFPVNVQYRGHENRLFKRDFAGEFMKKYPDVKLIDYGFVYHLDPNFPQDDITWFLMKKC